jgi:cytochrome c biogenesis protein
MEGNYMEDKEISAGIPEAIFKFFASLQLTVALLLALAAASIFGTLIPQNEDPAAYFQAYGEFLFRLFSVLDLFDMYHSWWFQLMLVLLTVNIIVCSIDRLSSLWKIVFVKTPPFRIARFRKQPNQNFTRDGSPESVAETYKAPLAKSFGYTRMESRDGGVFIFGEKWRWTRLGVYVVHLSVVLLLVGGLIGSLFGFEGFVNIAEGESANSVRLRNSNGTRPLDFTIQCDDFDVSFYPNGAPKEFRSALKIIENGKTVVEKSIIVNDPLRYKGISFYQASYGELAPEQQAPAASPPETIVLNFTSPENGMVYQQKVKMGATVEVPKGLGRFTLKDYQPAGMFGGQNIGEILVGTFEAEGKEPQEVMLSIRFPNFDRMRKGEVVISVDPGGWDEVKRNQPMEKRYYTGLQVTRDPGVWVVYTGFILMIAGCFITFFMSHQQVCVAITGKGKKSSVSVSGIANKNKLGMKKRVEELANKLSALE